MSARKRRGSWDTLKKVAKGELACLHMTQSSVMLILW